MGVPETLGLRVLLPVRVPLALKEAQGLAVALRPAEADGVEHRVAVTLEEAQADAEVQGVAERVALLLSVALALREGDTLLEALTVELGLAARSVELTEAEPVAQAVAVEERHCVTVALAQFEEEAQPVELADPRVLRVCETLPVGVRLEEVE